MHMKQKIKIYPAVTKLVNIQINTLILYKAVWRYPADHNSKQRDTFLATFCRLEA